MKIILLGLGKSIKYIKKFLKSKKIDIVHAVFKEEYKKKYVLADETLLEYSDIDYVIKSPGISETNKLYLKLRKKYQFINELDLLKLFDINVKTIVITGTNGKTTMVNMLKHIFDKINIKSIACGNSFEPVIKYYKRFKNVDYLIIEQSSFQLHNLSMYNPFISIILNIDENHLDMSYSFSSYIENKKNIYKYQNKQNYFIYDINNKFNKNIITNANIIDLIESDINLITNKDLTRYKLQIDYIYTIFKILCIDVQNIRVINDFKRLKYRETITKVNETIFINDSKSTSISATIHAFNNIENKNNIILILGGKDKNISFDKVSTLNARYVISYGQIINKVKHKNLIQCNSLYNAFNIATNIALKDKVILFSPGCSSFDKFKSYIQRGRYFDKLVKNYAKSKQK